MPRSIKVNNPEKKIVYSDYSSLLHSCARGTTGSLHKLPTEISQRNKVFMGAAMTGVGSDAILHQARPD